MQTHYVISEGQPDLDGKQNSSLSSEVQVGVSQPTAHTDPLESQTSNQQQTTQYIITTTTNGSGGSEVHISKPRTFSAEHEWKSLMVPFACTCHLPDSPDVRVPWDSICFNVYAHIPSTKILELFLILLEGLIHSDQEVPSKSFWDAFHAAFKKKDKRSETSAGPGLYFWHVCWPLFSFLEVRPANNFISTVWEKACLTKHFLADCRMHIFNRSH